jgi:hypothetical protein
MSALSHEARTHALKNIILKLHEGLSAEEAKKRFESEVGSVTSTEIAAMEQSLIDEGLSPDEIKKFCNVHTLIFQSALEKATLQETSPSHPVHLFKQENREIEKLVDSLKKSAVKKAALPALKKELKESLLKLKAVEKHYERKEQLLFPFLEKHGFMGPSKVMWGKDNEIRGLLSAALQKLEGVSDAAALAACRQASLDPLCEEVTGMIFKEENILFPAALEKLSADEWVGILRESGDIGYAFISPPEETDALVKHLEEALLEEACIRDNAIELPTGNIKLDELVPLLNTLPVDITFVDKDDKVRYFSQGKDRIFSRTRAVIGRTVQNCHPPQSLPTVEKILNSFKTGARDAYDFWINLKGRLVYIRYFAVRDSQKRYLGTLEVTQDITGIKKLAGERRLIDEGG